MRVITIGSPNWQDEGSVVTPLTKIYREVGHLQIVYRGQRTGLDGIVTQWIQDAWLASWNVERELWSGIFPYNAEDRDRLMVARGVDCAPCRVEGYVLAWPLGSLWQDTRACMRWAEARGLHVVNCADRLTQRLYARSAS